MATIYGTDGADTLTGGRIGVSAANDRLKGGFGDDTYLFTELSGFDVIEDAGGTDQIVLDSTLRRENIRLDADFSSDNDLYIQIVDEYENQIAYILIDDHFRAGESVERLRFADGGSIDLMAGLQIQGTVSNTFLTGTSLSDRMIFSGRNETLEGGNGDDFYVLDAMDAFNTINETSGTDTLLLEGISADRVRLDTDSYYDHLYISVVDAYDNEVASVTARNHFQSGRALEAIQFDDGSKISLSGELTIQGSIDNVKLYGTSRSDILIMSGRDEQLSGRNGDDVYRMGADDGFNTIYETGGQDTLHLEGIERRDVRIDSYYNDLVVRVVDDYDNTVARVVVNDHFENGETVETLRFDDGFTVDLQAGLTVSGAVDNTVIAATGRDDTLLSSGRHETLQGGAGNDVYIFQRGFGEDEIDETNGQDTVVLKGIRADMVELRPSSGWSNDLLITVRDRNAVVTDEITIDNYFYSSEYKIENLQIGRSVWSITDLLEGVTTSNRADTLVGGPGATVIDGRGGNDRITDLFGDNILSGGGGRDTIRAGRGNDLISGGGGADKIWGGKGDDVISGDRGRDILSGGKGEDRFVFRKRDGNDRIEDFDRKDILVLDDALWKGNLSARQVVKRFAEDLGDSVEFDFGRKGSILLEDVGSLKGLAADIEFI